MLSQHRIGHGYDIHRLVTGRPLVLGGVTIPHNKGLDGHSDADCLTHAISDAILGALGLPDIGHHFANTDPQWKNMNSQDILKYAAEEAARLGFSIVNLDTSLIAEEPKVAPHLTAMKSTLASTLAMESSQIGIKATTNEKVDDIGRGLAIAAHAVVLLARQS